MTFEHSQRLRVEMPILLFLQKDILSKRNSKHRDPKVGVGPDVAGNARRQACLRQRKWNRYEVRETRASAGWRQTAQVPWVQGLGIFPQVRWKPLEAEGNGSNMNQLIFQATVALSGEQIVAALEWDHRADRKRLQHPLRHTLSSWTERWVTESHCGCILKTEHQQELLIAWTWGMREKESQLTPGFFSVEPEHHDWLRCRHLRWGRQWEEGRSVVLARLTLRWLHRCHWKCLNRQLSIWVWSPGERSRVEMKLWELTAYRCYLKL